MRILISLLLLVVSAPALAAAWEPLDEGEGVTLYKRLSASSPFAAVKGVGVIDAPIQKVAAVLLDDDRMPEWVDDVEARVVRVVNANEYIEYNHVKLPPLLRDREFISEVTMAADPVARTVLIMSQPAVDPGIPESSRVRGELHAAYELQAIDATHTRISVSVSTNPKGSIPAWLVNYFQRDWSFETFRGIRKQCAKADIAPPKLFREFLAPLAAYR